MSDPEARLAYIPWGRIGFGGGDYEVCRVIGPARWGNYGELLGRVRKLGSKWQTHREGEKEQGANMPMGVLRWRGQYRTRKEAGEALAREVDHGQTD